MKAPTKILQTIERLADAFTQDEGAESEKWRILLKLLSWHSLDSILRVAVLDSKGRLDLVGSVEQCLAETFRGSSAIASRARGAILELVNLIRNRLVAATHDKPAMMYDANTLFKLSPFGVYESDFPHVPEDVIKSCRQLLTQSFPHLETQNRNHEFWLEQREDPMRDYMRHVGSNSELMLRNSKESLAQFETDLPQYEFNLSRQYLQEMSALSQRQGMIDIHMGLFSVESDMAEYIVCDIINYLAKPELDATAVGEGIKYLIQQQRIVSPFHTAILASPLSDRFEFFVSSKVVGYFYQLFCSDRSAFDTLLQPCLLDDRDLLLICVICYAYDQNALDVAVELAGMHRQSDQRTSEFIFKTQPFKTIRFLIEYQCCKIIDAVMMVLHNKNIQNETGKTQAGIVSYLLSLGMQVPKRQTLTLPTLETAEETVRHLSRFGILFFLDSRLALQPGSTEPVRVLLRMGVQLKPCSAVLPRPTMDATPFMKIYYGFQVLSEIGGARERGNMPKLLSAMQAYEEYHMEFEAALEQFGDLFDDAVTYFLTGLILFYSREKLLELLKIDAIAKQVFLGTSQYFPDSELMLTCLKNPKVVRQLINRNETFLKGLFITHFHPENTLVYDEEVVALAYSHPDPSFRNFVKQYYPLGLQQPGKLIRQFQLSYLLATYPELKENILSSLVYDLRNDFIIKNFTNPHVLMQSCFYPYQLAIQFMTAMQRDDFKTAETCVQRALFIYELSETREAPPIATRFRDRLEVDKLIACAHAMPRERLSLINNIPYEKWDALFERGSRLVTLCLAKVSELCASRLLDVTERDVPYELSTFFNNGTGRY